MQLPTGNLTFLFTDIEGSTRLWEISSAWMGPALALHDRIMREAVSTHHGLVFKTVGDAFCVVFNAAPDAVAAAAAAQRRLVLADWEGSPPLKVRMAIHTGVAELREADYFGSTLNRVARILAAGHGGQTLLSLVTRELVQDRLAAGLALRDLGENRLKDLARPERIFELALDGATHQFPPLRSLEQFPHNLPVQLTSFIGREKELAEVRQHLEHTHLLTLIGPGGTGKTRLSLQIAAELVEHYPAGVWLVEFATENKGNAVAEFIADVLGIRPDREVAIERALAQFLQGKKILLILDNCEHLVANIARVAELLLRQAPNLRILASSRTPLGIAGEVTLPVPPLSSPQLSRWDHLTRYSPDDLLAFDSVRLFLERATAVSPAFRLTEANAEAVARICYRLDGIALAIELAAARIKVLPPEQIAARLQDRFSLLTGGSRTALPRQQTLRALIDWSYDLLSEKERILFHRLAVFTGGRTLEAIESVCADAPLEGWEILDLLTLLLDKSLVGIEDGPAGEPRYVMTESIWQYALEKLEESPEREAIRHRHLSHFLAIAEEAEPHLKGPEQARWLERLASDRMNFRFAIEGARRSPEHAEAGLRLAVALTRFWEVRSNLKEGRDTLLGLLEVYNGKNRLLCALALGAAGRLAWCQDDNETARTLCTKAVQELLDLGEEVKAGESIGLRGFIERLENEIDVAEQSFLQCRAIAEKNNVTRLRALVFAGLGSIAGDRGDYEEALRLKHCSLEIFRELGDRYLVGLNSWSLGDNALEAGKIDAAEAYFRECCEIAVELANRWVMPHLLEGMGGIFQARGDAENGLLLVAAASVLRERLGLSFVQAEAERFETGLRKIRETLGTSTFQTIWAAGRLLTPPKAFQIGFPGIDLQ